MRTVMLALVTLVLASPMASAQGRNEQKRIDEAAAVLRDMTDIPPEIWQKANCVGVIPSVKKAAFIVGGEYGKGLVSCRTANGWSAPAFYELERGSWGLQAGGEMIDFVFFVMNQSGIERLLQDKFTLGGAGSVAAGPVGRNATAATDLQMHAEILSYSRSQGLFAGINLNGGVLKPDKDANADMYGPNTTARALLISGTVHAPATAKPFMAALVAAHNEGQGQPAIK